MSVILLDGRPAAVVQALSQTDRGLRKESHRRQPARRHGPLSAISESRDDARCRKWAGQNHPRTRAQPGSRQAAPSRGEEHAWPDSRKNPCPRFAGRSTRDGCARACARVPPGAPARAHIRPRHRRIDLGRRGLLRTIDRIRLYFGNSAFRAFGPGASSHVQRGPTDLCSWRGLPCDCGWL